MFKSILASTLFGVSFLGIPVLAQDSPYPRIDSCEYRVSVSDNVVDNTIRIQVAEGNTCPISDKVFLFIQDNRPQPLKLSGNRENFLSSTWVVSSQGVRFGQYRVMGINPTPNGIGDNDYIRSFDLGIDQVITIGGEQSAPAAPSPVVLPPAPQQVTTLDPESKQLLRNFDQWMRIFDQWMRNFDQWMRWFKANLPQLPPPNQGD